jgi:translation initiation factor 6
MTILKYRIKGQDYIGVFATATDKYVLMAPGLTPTARKIMSDALEVDCIEVSVAESDLVGIFSRGNSNGVLLSNMATDSEIRAIKRMIPSVNVERLESNLNTIGNNILANDKIAIVNPDYVHEERKRISDVLGVEVIAGEPGGFKTVGANNIMTNTGLVINNRASEEDKEFLDKISGFKSVRTTGNTGSLSIGISVVANWKGIVAGEATTGFEVNRMMEGLNIND